jgi:hypothetical protein
MHIETTLGFRGYDWALYVVDWGFVGVLGF